jgi:uncharacterized protein YodC (DUF2158 family)
MKLPNRILSINLLALITLPFLGLNPFDDSKWFPQILMDDSKNYLPDFSFAGYRWGETELPSASGKVLDVTSFGAAANDNIDDTPAFNTAIASANNYEGNVIISVPPGKFIIKDILWIERSNLILQGSGNNHNGTILLMPTPMEEMELPPKLVELKTYLIDNDKKVSTGEYFSVFSWTGGIIWTRSKSINQQILADVIEGKRGGQKIIVSDNSKIKSGDVLQIRWYNTEGKQSTLLNHIMDNQEVICGERLYEEPEKSIIKQEVSIQSVDKNTITIKEKLLHAIKPGWKVDLAAVNFIEEVGFENFTVEFPNVPNKGHHIEAGFNAFYLTGLLHSWIKNVKIINADNGILSDDCKNVTIENLEVSGRHTHYNVHLGDCRYMIVKNFKFNSSSYHTPSFNTGSILNVFSGGYVREAKLDQHCGLNHQNLFDNLYLELTELNNLFEHGGAGYWKPTAGAFNTFWNLKIEYQVAAIPKINNAPSARFVGIHGPQKLEFEYRPNAYFEGMNKDNISVPSLYDYQLQLRLSGL